MGARSWFEVLNCGTSADGTVTNAAKYKTTLQSFRNNLNTVGLKPVTAVSGQVDIDAITVAPTKYTSAQYIVYELDDALSSTAPIYIKFSFMLVSNYAQNLYVVVQVGTTVDNATGVLGGQVTDARAVSVTPTANVYGDAAAKLSIFSRQLGFAAVIFNMSSVQPNAANNNNGRSSCCVIIERTTDPDGAFTADGYTVFMTDSPAATTVGTLVSRTFHGAYDSGWVTTSRRPWGHTVTSAGDGGVMLTPVMKLGYAGELIPTKNLITYYYNQYTQGSVFTANTLQSGAKQFAAVGYSSNVTHNEGQNLGCVVDTNARLLCLAVGFE